MGQEGHKAWPKGRETFGSGSLAELGVFRLAVCLFSCCAFVYAVFGSLCASCALAVVFFCAFACAV